MRASSTELFAAMAALLVKKPRTVRELADCMGLRSTTTLYRNLEALRAEGLVYIGEWKYTHKAVAAVYAWQPSVCCFTDARRPDIYRNQFGHNAKALEARA